MILYNAQGDCLTQDLDASLGTKPMKYTDHDVQLILYPEPEMTWGRFFEVIRMINLFARWKHMSFTWTFLVSMQGASSPVGWGTLLDVGEGGGGRDSTVS